MRNEVAARGVGQVGFEQALELEERLVVEHHVINVANAAGCFIQTIVHRASRKISVEFFSGKSFLLSSRNYAAVRNERSGAVVIKCGKAKDVYGRLTTTYR